MDQILNWEQCNEALARLGAVRRELNIIELGVNEQVEALRSEGAAKATPLEEERQRLAELIEAFATEHRADFGSKKSKPMAAGEIGWKSSAASLEVPDVEATIQRAQAMGLNDIIRTKIELDKTALKKADEKVMKQLGVSLEKKERFFINPL